MKKICMFLVATSVCLLVGCNSATSEHSQIPPTDTHTTTSALEMPDEMKKYAENPNVQWMAGLLVDIEDAVKIESISQERYEVPVPSGGTICATVTMQNGLKETQRYEMMVFADGIPVEFEIEGKQYKSYPIDLTPQYKMIEIKLKKDFALNLGRLDVLLSFSENPQADYHLACYDLWIDLVDEQLVPKSLCTTIEQRIGVKGKYTDESYDAWIWNEGVVPTDIDNAGPRIISIHNEETILFEAISGLPGLYRTVFVMNGHPVDFEWNGTQYSYIDWESTGSNMLQLPIQLTDVPSTGSFYTITTPLNADAMAQPIVASRRIELTASEE